ncbi:MAG: hypothetical protein U0Y68_08310 [Blastocatellia bacterium]
MARLLAADSAFLPQLREFQQPIARAGMFNSLMSSPKSLCRVPIFIRERSCGFQFS